MNTDSLRDARVLVTGAGGFLGRHLHRVLEERYGCRHVYAVGGYSGRPSYHHPDLTLPGYDLSNTEEAHALFTSRQFDYVFHLAGYNGGIQFNLENPFDIFATNTLMAANVLDMARRTKVKKVLSVVASCAYPEWEWRQAPGVQLGGWNHHLKWPREVMREHDFLDGPPHFSVACHGYAKRNLLLMSAYAHEQYDLDAVCVCPTTLYGPGDSFDPARTKVMGGMVKRFVDAVDEQAREVTVWGTGQPLREFLYVEDAAWLLVEAMLKYGDWTAPLNLGTGQELSVREVAETVADAVKYCGRIHFDTTKPDGQSRKRLDLTRMTEVIGPFAPTPLAEGVRRTADYYRALKAGDTTQ